MLPLEWVESPPAMTLAQARAYCAQLARSHYENFHVVTFLLPRGLRQDFFNVYSYCRWSDDLADETGDRSRSLKLLALWEEELERCYAVAAANQRGSAGFAGASLDEAGQARHPVFLALEQTVRARNVPIEPFRDLLRAFVQDQQVSRYAKYDDLLGYCRYSANPVGRLVLYLCGYRDPERQGLSDSTCTALQLANFWQDVIVDYAKGRVYLPLEDLARFGCSEEQIARREFSPAFGELMRFEVERARDLFRAGLPLTRMVDRRLAADIELFSRGGMEILKRIEEQGYNVLAARPALGTFRKLRLLASVTVKYLAHHDGKASVDGA